MLEYYFRYAETAIFRNITTRIFKTGIFKSRPKPQHVRIWKNELPKHKKYFPNIF